jgi:glycosyltransferase involved in cell wall biosynthesis
MLKDFDILIADDAESFAKEIIKVLSSKKTRLELGKNAQELIRQKYDNRKISSAIVDFIKSLS